MSFSPQPSPRTPAGQAGALLALDLGTTTGWAMRLVDGTVVSGTMAFRPGRYEGGGMRFLRFRSWLDHLHDGAKGIGTVYFEEVRRHAGTDAAHLYGGFLAHLTAWCELNHIPYQGVPVGAIKRHATGKGKGFRQLEKDLFQQGGVYRTPAKEQEIRDMLAREAQAKGAGEMSAQAQAEVLGLDIQARGQERLAVAAREGGRAQIDAARAAKVLEFAFKNGGVAVAAYDQALRRIDDAKLVEQKNGLIRSLEQETAANDRLAEAVRSGDRSRIRDVTVDIDSAKFARSRKLAEDDPKVDEYRAARSRQPDTGAFAIAHTGGLIGLDRLDSRSVASSHFVGAPRFLGGGLVAGERPIIAKVGEGVFTPRQMDNADRLLGAALSRPAAAVNVQVTVYNNANGTEAKAQWSQGADGNVQVDVFVEEIENRLNRRIGRGEGMAPVLEHRYGLNPAAGAYR